MNFPVVKIHRVPGAKIPQASTEFSAAMDVRACLPADTVIDLSPGERISIPTGLSFEIPVGYFISLRPRSGLAIKQGITLVNSPATIDSDYRGEMKVIVINHGQQLYRIEHGDRIAQLILEKIVTFKWQEIENIDRNSTTRATDGFGSTGMA